MDSTSSPQVDSTTLVTTIGLEIHVQLKTKSKMFCSCDNQSFVEATDGKYAAVEPNTLVCPVCLGLPGALPVANKQAILWTIKTGLALGCSIPKIAKFDRKHYFYPDLPKGYQISQYDEPFAINGSLKSKVEEEEITIRLNRIHLEEDAGKLIHSGGKSLVDLNRSGTPLMEIVTEPDITSPEMAGQFLRKLQKIVRDVVEVSDADMEKGHLRCDANISISERPKDENGKHRMSQIIELKNLNSFRFVEKALALVETKLKEEHEDWPAKLTKETWGYDSINNEVYLQRRKEEAADYRYFPEPDLPPFDTSAMNLDILKSEFKETEEEKIDKLTSLGIPEAEGKVLASDRSKSQAFCQIKDELSDQSYPLLAKAIVHNYFGFVPSDEKKSAEFAKAIDNLADGKINKQTFTAIVQEINCGKTFEDAFENSQGEAIDLSSIVGKIVSANLKELERYKNGEKQLFGFFMGQLMKETKGQADPREANRILKEKLEK